MKKILIHIFIFSLVFTLIFFSAPCPFKLLFSVPCPACGIVHSMHALLVGDFKGYLTYNPLALPAIVAVWAGIHKNSIFKKNKAVDIFAIICGALLIVLYIFRKIKV